MSKENTKRIINPINMPLFVDFRLEKELKTIDIIKGCSIKETSDKDDKFHRAFLYNVSIKDGIFEGRDFVFIIYIYREYPFRAPKVICKSKIYHPNIDFEGNVCMNILREDWSGAFGLQTITLGLYTLFYEIHGEDALNTEAGDLLLKSYDEYVIKAQRYK